MNDKGLKDFDVLAILEPHLHQDIDTGEPNPGIYHQWQPLVPTSQRKDGAIQHRYRSMLWVNNKALARQLPVDSYDITAAVIRSGQAQMIIAAVYDANTKGSIVERNANLLGKLELVQEAVTQARAEAGRDTPVLICTDLNRHDAIWAGVQPIAARRHEGDLIVDFAQTLGLVSLLEPGTITWEHQTQDVSSTIDVIWGSVEVQDQLQWCRLYREDHGSDHQAIEIQFGQEAARPRPYKPRWELSKADWPAINTRLQQTWRLDSIRENPANIDQVAESLVTAVQDAIQAETPLARPSPYVKRWWSIDLTILRNAMTSMRNAVRTAQRRGHEVDTLKARLRQARQQYYTEMDRQKRRHWRSFLEDPANIWKANQYAKLARTARAIPALRDGDRLAETDEEKAVVLLHTFFPIPPVPQGDDLPIQAGQEPRPVVGMPAIVTMGEAKEAILSSNPRKAPGRDGLPFLVWQKVLDTVLPTITWLYSVSLKTGYVPKSWRTARMVPIPKPNKPDYSLPKAYRPISLLPTISKGLERIVAKRLAYLAEKLGLLPENHFGGRRKRSSEQALDVLMEAILRAWRTNRVASVITFDVQGAFNGVHTSVLCSRLEQRGVHPVLVRWVKGFCEGRQGEVVIGQHTSALQTIQHAGIPQGSPLSPILYVFYNASLVESEVTAQGGSIGFIDDYTAWAVAHTAEEGTRLLQQQVVPKAEQWAQASGATFEADKTGLVHFTRTARRTSGHTSLQFQGVTVAPQPHMKVLGVILDQGLHMTAHIERVCTSARKKCLAIGRLRGMRPKQMRQLYQSVVLPTLLYGASTWFAQGRRGIQRLISRCDRVQALGAKMVIGAFKTVAGVVAVDEAGLDAVEETLGRRMALHLVSSMAQPKKHLARAAMAGYHTRGAKHCSPLYGTWEANYQTVQKDAKTEITPALAVEMAPWAQGGQELQLLVLDRPQALRKLAQAQTQSGSVLMYTDASARNKVCGIGLVGPDDTNLVGSHTIGWASTCSVLAAEVRAIGAAVCYLLGAYNEKHFYIATDSQEAIQLLQQKGRKAKAREVVQGTLQAVDNALSKGIGITVLWIPAHSGIPGNEAAHWASQDATRGGCKPTQDPKLRVREKALVIKRLETERPWKSTTQKRERVGRHTYALDAALPGKHTLKLYGLLSREDAGILAQARTGHTHLNAYLKRIGAAEVAACQCGRASETVRHILLDCETWKAEREELRECAGGRWGDMSYLLGGYSHRLDPQSWKNVDGPRSQWKPDTAMVLRTIQFLKQTGRMAALAATQQ